MEGRQGRIPLLDMEWVEALVDRASFLRDGMLELPEVIQQTVCAGKAGEADACT